MAKNKRIILLHGWGASVRKLEPLKKELEKLGWDALLLKLPGFDGPNPEKPWTLDEYSSYVLKMVNEKWKNGKYVVFGHSFGGRIAIKMALTEDKKLNGIVLCASGGISRASPIKRIPFMLMAKIGKIFNLYTPIATFWRKSLYKLAREHDYERTKGTMKSTMKNVIEEELKKEIVHISYPVLILWGNQDKITPYNDAKYLQNNIKLSKLISFPDQGHKLPYELPEAIAKEIDKWAH